MWHEKLINNTGSRFWEDWCLLEQLNHEIMLHKTKNRQGPGVVKSENNNSWFFSIKEIDMRHKIQVYPLRFK